jgi:hypothetical protein
MEIWKKWIPDGGKELENRGADEMLEKGGTRSTIYPSPALLEVIVVIDFSTWLVPSRPG